MKRKVSVKDEIPKHLKKKGSSVSKSKNKSSHKHAYVDCLLVDEKGKPYKAAYCKFCGKIGNMNLIEPIKVGHGVYRRLTVEEIYEKYKELPQIHVKDIFLKYVPQYEGLDDL